MRFKRLYFWDTSAGRFYIGQSNDGRFHPIYNDESYGSYSQPWQAAEDLACNATFSISSTKTGIRIDTSNLGIPPHTSEWKKVLSPGD